MLYKYRDILYLIYLILPWYKDSDTGKCRIVPHKLEVDGVRWWWLDVLVVWIFKHIVPDVYGSSSTPDVK